MGRSREKASTKKTSKVQRTSLKTHPNSPIPETPKIVNPELKTVYTRNPKNKKFRQPAKKEKRRHRQ